MSLERVSLEREARAWKGAGRLIGAATAKLSSLNAEIGRINAKRSSLPRGETALRAFVTFEDEKAALRCVRLYPDTWINRCVPLS